LDTMSARYYVEGISADQKALREAIEKRIDKEEHVIKNPTDYDYRFVEDARKIFNTGKNILRMMENVTPKVD